MNLSTAFPFTKEPGHVVCLVGGGGKTSLMYKLAQAGAAAGMKVLVTTSTHILAPDQLPLVTDAAGLAAAFREHDVVCAGEYSAERKLSYPSALDLEDARRLADLILIEADGARMLPCKMPAAHEPVIPAQCDTVIGVMGMDTAGRPLGEICFRKELVMAFLGTDENHIMTTDDMARILTDPRGTMKGVGTKKYIIALNKCDDIYRKALASSLKETLVHMGYNDVYCMALQVTDEIL